MLRQCYSGPHYGVLRTIKTVCRSEQKLSLTAAISGVLTGWPSIATYIWSPCLRRPACLDFTLMTVIIDDHSESS